MARQIVGEIFLNVKPLDGGVGSGVQKIIDKASEQAAEVPVSADTTEAEQAVARLGASIEDDVGGAWIAATAQAAAFTVAVVQAKNQIERTVAKLGGLFDQLAQAQAGFTAILGSDAAGSQLLDDIREFARVTPFVTQELVNYSQQLLGVGQAAESIVPLLSSVGDVISSVGGDTQNISRVLFTLTQIRSIGRLVGQDAIQLQSALIPITKILADFLDITTQEVKKLQEQGAITADTVFEAITAAGLKVEGAMLTATRNISGAQAVLSDSIEILLQESEFLKAVFEDIVAGMLEFDAALSEGTNIRVSIDAISEALASLYDDLQPLLEGFIELSGGLAINAIDVLASSLTILASAVNSIDEEALKAFGQALALYAALKAPIVLIKYVNTLRQLAASITPAAILTNLNKAEKGFQGMGTEAEIAEQKVAALQRRTQRLALGFGVAALAAGTFLKTLDETNAAIQGIGSSLQGAGLGAQLGATFGPQGALIGAAAGAGAGFIASFVTSARDEARRRSAEMAEIGVENASAFLEAFAFTISGGVDTTNELESFFTDIQPLQDTVDAYDDLVSQAEELDRKIEETLLGGGRKGIGEADVASGLFDALDVINTELDSTRDSADTARAELESLLTTGVGKDALDELAAKLAAVNKEAPALGESISELIGSQSELNSEALKVSSTIFDNFRIKLLGTGQAVGESSEDFYLLIDALEAAGTSIDEVFNLSVDDLIAKISDELPSALTQTRTELSLLKKAFDEGKKAIDEYFDPFGSQVNQAKEAVEQSGKLADAQKKIVEEGIKGNGFGYAEALEQSVKALAAANIAVFDDSPRAIADGLSFAQVALEDLKNETKLTNEEFEDFLESVGLLELFLASQTVAGGFSGTLEKLALDTGLSVEALKELLRVSEDVDANDTKITVTAETVGALRDIQRLESGVIDSSSGMYLAAQETREELGKIAGVGGAYRIAASDVTESGNIIIDSLTGYFEEIQRIQRAFTQGSQLGDLFEQIQVEGEGSIDFANALLENFQTISNASLEVFGDQEKALNDGLSFIAATLGSLQTELGLSDDAFQDLLSTMGLLEIFNDSLSVDPGFFGSIDELIESSGLANDQLRNLLGLSEALSGDTEITVTADITQALAEIEVLFAEIEASGEVFAGIEINRLRQQIDRLREEGGGIRVVESGVLEEAQRKAEEERQKANEAATREAEQFARERERELEEAQREAERIANEQERIAEEALRAQEQFLQDYESASDTLAKSLESAANTIDQAAKQWTASIKERTQQDRAVPVERLIRNADRQAGDLEFLDEALQQLQNRGFSKEAASAVGIDGLDDVRQVQRLLSASDEQLRQLSTVVGQRDSNAEVIARRQQQAETQATIVAAIVQAATILGVDISPERARELSATFIVDGRPVSNVPDGILDILANVGQIVRG